MPRAKWTPKQERMYSHILDSCSTSGKPQTVCQRIAAATVNKHRAKMKAKRKKK